MNSQNCSYDTRNGTRKLRIIGILVLLTSTMAAPSRPPVKALLEKRRPPSGPPVETLLNKGRPPKSHFPSLELLNATMRTTALRDFAGHHEAFVAAHYWQHSKLLDTGEPAPHLACAEYGKGYALREQLLQKFPSSGIYTISHSTKYGACYIFTSKASEAEELISDPSISGLTSVGPFLSTLKITPGLLDHTPREDGLKNSDSPTRLRTTYGRHVAMADLRGLSIRLSPGVMKVRSPSIKDFAASWKDDLQSGSLDAMKSSNFWADPEMLNGEGGHLARPQAKMLAREWASAADVLEKKIEADGGLASDVCEWQKVRFHPAEDDLVLVTEMDHLLPGDEESELKVPCFMYFLSHLASKPEVFHVTPLPKAHLLNDVVSAIVQSANIVDKPLHDVGLIGTGEVIQIIDSGLDETSCFFTDDSGLEIEHGSFYDGFTDNLGDRRPIPSPTSSYIYDLTRRKIVQYIELFKRADPDVDQIDGDGYYYYSEVYGDGSGDGHHEDEEEGHGTGVAGVAAGSAISDFVVSSCPSGTQAGCVGKCITATEADSYTNNDMHDIDTYCPTYNCDGDVSWSPNCLTDDVEDTLRNSDGVAPGAKLSIFDMSHGGTLQPADPGNGLWYVSLDAGAKIHSNSWGYTSSLCQPGNLETIYDDFSYQNPEHLLIFAAGNEGAEKDRFDGVTCTVLSPGLAKNTLTVGASSTGPTRAPTTGADGLTLYQERGEDPNGSNIWGLGPPSTSTTGADIDTMASFSSYGYTEEGRIKPEIVAPGDRVFTASSDGTDSHSCQLLATSGTSFAAPAVAGAAAMVRQYFMDSAFHLSDLQTRGWCYDGTSAMCYTFSPSAATVKAVMINSANLMGGSTTPDRYHGFGRVHLEEGLRFGGEGYPIFVVDSSTAYLESFDSQSWSWDADPSAGKDIRVTLSWTDPAGDALSPVDIVNNLDLRVTGPDGVDHYMWDNGPSVVNTNERVIIPAAEVTSGGWQAEVSSGDLDTPYQSFSLVISAAFA